MKQLAAGDSRVIKIVQRKTLPQDGEWRLSRFVFVYGIGDLVLLDNTLTRQVYALSGEEWESVQRADMTLPHVKMLAEMCFLMEKELTTGGSFQMRNSRRKALFITTRQKN